jgi:hypothetical protein
VVGECGEGEGEVRVSIAIPTVLALVLLTPFYGFVGIWCLGSGVWIAGNSRSSDRPSVQGLSWFWLLQ